jgi:hypothetical protein
MPKYGYIESSIDFDDSKGMWSMFYLQTPYNYNGRSGQNPRDRGTEMDIVEHKVWSHACGGESDVAPSALHWILTSWDGQTGHSPDASQVHHAGGDRHAGAWPNSSLANGYHTYGLEWTPAVLRYKYDDQLVWTVNNDTTNVDPPSDGCGGVCFPSVCEGTQGPVSDTLKYIVLGSRVTNNSDGYGPIPPDGYGPLSGQLASTTKMRVEYVRHYVPAPSGLVATPVTFDGQVDLTWSDNSYGLYGFSVERSTDGVSFSPIGTVGAGVHTYHDTGLIACNR